MPRGDGIFQKTPPYLKDPLHQWSVAFVLFLVSGKNSLHKTMTRHLPRHHARPSPQQVEPSPARRYQRALSKMQKTFLVRGGACEWTRRARQCQAPHQVSNCPGATMRHAHSSRTLAGTSCAPMWGTRTGDWTCRLLLCACAAGDNAGTACLRKLPRRVAVADKATGGQTRNAQRAT